MRGGAFLIKKKSHLRLIASTLAIALVMVTIPYSAQVTFADSISDLQEEKAALQARIASLEGKKNSLSNDLEDQKAKKKTIDEQIEIKQEQLDLNDRMISTLNSEITENETSIKNKEQEVVDREAAIKDRFAHLQGRLRVVSKTGNMSVLQMLFDTDSYVDYLLKSKFMQTIAANDERLIAELEEEIKVINETKKELEAKKADLDKQKAALEKIRAEADADKAELEALSNEAESTLQELQSDIDYYDSEINATEEQIQQMESEIQSILDRSSGSNQEAYLGGLMYWPSKSCTLITDTFGWRMLSGSSNFHKGIDIACYGSAYGKDIIAAEDGIVIYANNYDSWGGGYGYYVMVDHGINSYGQRIVTVYAHMSAVYASEGQFVTGGETQLGAIGNTGWSYGSHLHFEVRVDGSYVDPLSNGYVSPP